MTGDNFSHASAGDGTLSPVNSETPNGAVESDRSNASPYQLLADDLVCGRRVLIDGGTGTELERRGVAGVQDAWSSAGALNGPDVVLGVHRDYLRAGARVVISNTFSTSCQVLSDGGLADRFEELNRRGVELACEARDLARAETGIEAAVAAGMAYWRFAGPPPSADDLRRDATLQAKIMAEAGADMFLLEMMTDVDRTLAMLDATEQTGLPTWVGFSCKVDGADTATPGMVRLLHGPTLAEGVEAVAERDVPAMLIMHTEVEDIDASLDVLDGAWSGPTGVYAHSGRFVNPDWVFNDVISAEDYATAAQGWLDRGVQIIGGCCGIGPGHIEQLRPLV